VKEIAGIVECAEVQRRAVHVDDNDPAESLVAELRREIHEHRAERGRSHGVGAGKLCWPPISFDPLAPNGICGTSSTVHPGLFATTDCATS
jgi:hypothetical protein